MPDIEFLNSWVTFVVAICAGLSWFWREALSKCWTRIRDVLSGALHVVDSFPRLADDLDYVKREVMYNGGASAKDLLRQMNNHVHYLLSEAKISTFITDSKGELICISDRAIEVLQCQRSDLLGNGWKSFLDPTVASSFLPVLKEAIRDGRSAHYDQVIVVTDRGKISINLELQALRNSEGRFSGYIGYARRSIIP